uniref:PALP domain-containing protein n=1 Tax=Onchocerca volvulus TaxID=6282 RepID=A0A8R1XQ11_ONCVO
MFPDKLKLLVLLIVIIRIAYAISVSSLSQAPLDEHKQENLWRRRAIAKLWEERRRMGRTPIFKLTSLGYQNVDFIFKNESASRTGSLKHRYSWALMMWALVDGKINENTTVYEASSGNTAASEAFMCHLIGVKFIAIVGGNYPLESVNLMHEVLAQMRQDLNQTTEAPHYFIHSAGTGGTISSVGRYVKKYGLTTEVVLADTQFSVYHDYVMNERFMNESGRDVWVTPGMAGIGFGAMGSVRHGITSSLLRTVIDRTIKIPDIASTAAMTVLKQLGINGGTSTGTNFMAALHLAAMHSKASTSSNKQLVIATIMGDTGNYYKSSYYNRTWINENFNAHGGLAEIEEAFKFGSDPLISGHERCDQSNTDMIGFRSHRIRL